MRLLLVEDEPYMAEAIRDGLTERNRRLLALCSIEGVNWSGVAREALRSGGLARLHRDRSTRRRRTR